MSEPPIEASPSRRSQPFGDDSARRPLLRILHRRGLRTLLVAVTLSGLGSWFHQLAAAILMYDLTSSGAWLGTLGAVYTGAVLLMGPIVGRVNDRHPHRLVLIASQLLAATGAFALGIAAMLDVVTPVLMLLLTPIIAVGAAFGFPTVQTIIPALIEPEDLAPVVAVNTAAFNATRVVGPALAALLVAQFGAGPAFAINGASFLPLLVVAVWTGRLWPTPSPAAGSSGRMMTAIGRIAADPRLVLDYGAVIAIGFVVDSTITLGPPLARTLGAGDGFVGLIAGAFGIGALLATTRSGTIGKSARPTGSIGLGVAGLAVAVTGFAVSPAMVIASMIVACGGYLYVIAEVTARIQREVGSDIRGRAMALWAMALLLGRLVASVLGGNLVDFAGTRAAYAAVAVVPVAVAIMMWRRHEH